jgi:S-DNA-T family DNA segregation ATPase FtsK/SpoIIIE
VPNKIAQPVCLREIIESRAWVDTNAEIPIVLGKEVTGKPLVADLTRMPHLLIAGSTGSGKTVCINAIIASLVYHSSPADLRFIMVDPKIVEMQVFNSLPHMLIPVVTSPKKVPAALKWLIGEMERRYHVFAKVGVRNIAGFNAKLLKDKGEQEKAKQLDAEMSAEERVAINKLEVPRDVDIEVPFQKMPYIVCIIDELADLMMVAPADIETCIARLAQLARAAGIHLIIATQRPSVNVITGVIKANLPCRIAFKVASKVDSRTILDYGGADALIGRGDMLFTPPGSSDMLRAQGAFVSDDEINGIVEFLKRNGPPEYAQEVQMQVDMADDDDGDSFGNDSNGLGKEWGDDMIPGALEVLRSGKRASTSMLQRRLRIGYNRAARIMEILEQQGVVGPENGMQPREILRDLDDLLSGKR